MAATFNYYNHTAKLLLNGNILGTVPGGFHTLKVMLLDENATFNATHTLITQVNNSGTYEVYSETGTGVSQGGIALTGVTVVQPAGSNDAYIDAADVSVLISGANLGPFCNYVIYDSIDANRSPLVFIALKDSGGLPAPQTVVDGNYLGIIWGANGIIKADAPAPV